MLNIGIFLLLLSPFTAMIPAIYMAIYIVRNKQLFEMNPLNIGLLALFAISVISGIINANILSILASVGILLLLSVAVYLQNNAFSKDAIEKMLRKIQIFSLFTALIGIVEKIASYSYNLSWISKLYWSASFVQDKSYRIYSTFGNPNVAGDWFAAMALVSLYFMQKSRGKEKLLNISAIGLFLFALMLTGSKGATLAFEVALLGYAFFKSSKSFRIIAAGVFVVVVIIALIFPEVNHPVQLRNAVWIANFKLFTSHPFLGVSLMGILQNTYEIHAHNIWLSLLSSLGLAGLSASPFASLPTK